MADSDPADCQPLTETEQVEAWRETQLVDAGYDIAAALELAKRPDVDLHKAADLLANGCDVTTAMEILL